MKVSHFVGMKNKPTFHAFKKSENGQIFVQFKKGGKFVAVDAEMAAYVVYVSLVRGGL